MSFVVTKPCENCVSTACVEVCPASCFHAGLTILLIDPNECIDCGLCVPECPVKAIFPESEVPDQWESYIGINATASEFPSIIAKQTPKGECIQ